ncbi:MAG TPA: DUF669 domain-containing protein [Kofleriaceae bacterium]|nr:DUF669 domain-containing protein [Kofleriaceae bacterium]
MNEPYVPSNDPFDLAQFDDAFAAAPVEDREYDDVPDGKYQVLVDKVEITEAKASGNKMLKWTLRIQGPRYAGRMLWRYNVLGTRENLRWLKTDLHTCGLDLVRLSDLPQHLGSLLDLRLEVSKRTKGGYSNIYLNRCLERDELETGDGGDDFGGQGVDRVPF